MSKPEAARAAFDDVAQGYDARFTQQPIALHLRAEVMEVVLALLPPAGANILEVGCGTGEDARCFAEHGHSVLATDAAPEMLLIAERKTGAIAPVETALWRVGSAVPGAVSERAPFDLLFSNFGAVNCVEDLAGFGRDCTRLVAPGGHVALVLINRWCLLEILLGALRLDRASMTRRFRKKSRARLEDGTTLEVHFPSGHELLAVFGPDFSPFAFRPVGVFLPPSEYFEAFQNRPRLYRLPSWLDRNLGRFWPLSRLADHMLVVMRHDPDLCKQAIRDGNRAK